MGFGAKRFALFLATLVFQTALADINHQLRSYLRDTEAKSRRYDPNDSTPTLLVPEAPIEPWVESQFSVHSPVRQVTGKVSCEAPGPKLWLNGQIPGASSSTLQWTRFPLTSNETERGASSPLQYSSSEELADRYQAPAFLPGDRWAVVSQTEASSLKGAYAPERLRFVDTQTGLEHSISKELTLDFAVQPRTEKGVGWYRIKNFANAGNFVKIEMSKGSFSATVVETPFRSIEWSSDDGKIVVGKKTSGGGVFDSRTGQPVLSLEKGESLEVDSIHQAPGDPFFSAVAVSSGPPSSARIVFFPETQKTPPAKPMSGFPVDRSTGHYLRFMGGQLIAFVSSTDSGQTVRVLEAATGKSLGDFPLPSGNVTGCPDPERLVLFNPLTRIAQVIDFDKYLRAQLGPLDAGVDFAREVRSTSPTRAWRALLHLKAIEGGLEREKIFDPAKNLGFDEPTARRVNELVENLGASKFRLRENASQQLLSIASNGSWDMHELIESKIRAKARAGDAEIQQRLKKYADRAPEMISEVSSATLATRCAALRPRGGPVPLWCPSSPSSN